MKTDTSNVQKDKKSLLAIVEEMSRSMSGAQSTKHWADDAVWFDVAPFASKGIKPAYKQFDDAFGSLKSCQIDILETEMFINGDMAVVCCIQRWNIVRQDGTVVPPMLIRHTDCFERRNGEWAVIHEHSSMPAGPGWNGKFIRE